MTNQIIRFAIICIHPPNGLFGLQDKKKNLIAGTQISDNQLQFDFELNVKQLDNGQPNFTGQFAHGTIQQRFVYLTLKDDTDRIIKRIKVQLNTIQWEQVEAVLSNPDTHLQAQVSGRGTATVPLLGEGWVVL